MRILSITAQKPSATGSGVYLTEVVRSLDKLGAEQAIVYGKMPKDVLPETLNCVKKSYSVDFQTSDLPFNIAGMSDVMPYPATRYRDFTDSMLQQFKRAFEMTISWAIQDFKPDLIITHHLYIVSAITSRLAYANNIKCVALSHGTDIRQMQWHNLDKDNIIEGIKKSTTILCLHNDQISKISEIYGIKQSNIHVIGAGYNSEIFNCNTRAEPLRKENTLCFCGKICTAKGVKSLLRACASIENPPHITLIGGHNNEAELLEIKKLADASFLDVDFTGQIPQTEVAEIYRNTKVFCLPSFFEGLPLVILEAAACGCYCVASALPGIPEWIQNNTHSAPFDFVKLPAMLDVDKPIETDLPDYESRLATAIKHALTTQANPSSVAHLTWDDLAKRLLGFVDCTL